MSLFQRFCAICMGCWTLCDSVAAIAQSAISSLTIVADRGGVSALPYYRALHLQPRSNPSTSRSMSSNPPNGTAAVPAGIEVVVPHALYGEATLLPVHSARLSPGSVTPRVIEAPGLTPFFLVGDDERSRAWLGRRLETLRSLHAIGFVVEVTSYAALEALRQLAGGLTLTPSSGDDLAARLTLRHYPVLVTATGIEQ